MDRTEDRGVYRRIPVRIMGAYHVPPDPLFVPEQMENLVAEFAGNQKLNPIERAALFHLKFEGIHPFVDGNGRTGRLILNLMLMQAGYPPINVKYSDRKRYYEAFDSYYRDNDKYFTKSIFNKTYYKNQAGSPADNRALSYQISLSHTKECLPGSTLRVIAC